MALASVCAIPQQSWRPVGVRERHPALCRCSVAAAIHARRRQGTSRIHWGTVCQAQASRAVSSQLQSVFGPSPEDQREFDTLWAEYARELQLSKETSNAIAFQARQGTLVCDAGILRGRALKFLSLSEKVPGLNPRNVLSQSSLTLRHEPVSLISTARRLLVLLPEHDITSTLVAVMAHVDLGPDVLACYLLELESVFCPCFFGAAVPPLVFGFFVSEQLELQAQSKSKSITGSQPAATPASSNLLETSSSEEEAQDVALSSQGSGDGLEGDVDDGDDDEFLDSGREPLDVVHFLVRLRGLISILGAEVAYTGLSRTPRVMLGVDTAQAQASHAALQETLRINAALAARMMESRGRLISLDAASLPAQLSALTIALGWPRPSVRALCLEEPIVLMRSPSWVGRLWRRLQRATKLHPAWSDALKQAPVDYFAILVRLPRPDETLGRFEFLSQARARQRKKVPPLERVMRTPINAFLREFPEYSLSRRM